MSKRDLFAELTEGFASLTQERVGKITLRKHKLELLPAPQMTASEVIAVRTKLHLSQAVFASYLRTRKRTVEGWDQGRARPNAQAVLLIKLVEKYPETVLHLATV